jgi:hypothetical protein
MIEGHYRMFPNDEYTEEVTPEEKALAEVLTLLRGTAQFPAELF